MCRYAQHIYKHHYACFSCRKMFRQPERSEMARPVPRDETRVVPCPQCDQPMTNMGWDFKAPRQSDIKQWQKVRELAANGIFFSSCGCNGPGPRPATLKEVKPFLAEHKRLSAEWSRTARIAQRACSTRSALREHASARRSEAGNEMKKCDRLVGV